MKKFLSLALVIVMMVAALSSCFNFGGGDPVDSDSDGEIVQTDPPKVTLIEAGKKAEYTVIYPDGCGDALLDAVNEFIDTLNETYPEMEISAQPAFKSWGATPANTHEILIGDTGRPDSENARSLVKGDTEYLVKLYDSGNLVIMGNNENILKTALEYVMDTYMDGAAEGFQVVEKLEYTGQGELAIRDGWKILKIPSYWGGTLSESTYATGYGKDFSYAGAGGKMHVVSNTSLTEFNSYIQSLERSSYTQVSTHTIGDNVSYQYKRDSILIYAYYTGSQKEARIIQDLASTPENEFEYTYNPKAGDTSTFYQYAMMYDPTGQGGYDPDNGKPYENNGLFDVIKLADNSVILLDGGWECQATDKAVDELMKFLREITDTPTGKVRIAALYFTHGHGDHFYFAYNLLKRHSSSVTVERIMHNFPGSGGISSDFSAMASLALKTNPQGVKFAKLHTGQCIQLANAKFEVLYTHEDRVDAKGMTEIYDYNDTSTILKMTLNGKTFLLLGDWGGQWTMNDEGNEHIVKAYQDMEAHLLAALAPAGGTNYLKCDVVQISHHAINDWMGNIYKAVDADIAFFPQQDVAYNNLAHVCYKNIIKQLEETGMSREDMHFAGRYTYGLTVNSDRTMKLTYRGIAGADSQYAGMIGRYSPFHTAKEKTYK